MFKEHSFSRKKILAVLIAFLVVLGGALWWWQNSESAASLVFSGTVEADQMGISAEISGKVLEVLVKEGDRVEAGQLVARLDREQSAYQLQQAEAAVKAAEAQWKEAVSGSRSEQIRQAEAILLRAQAAVKGAQEALAYREDNYRRVEELYRAGTASQQQLNDAKALVDEARSRLEQAEAEEKSAQANLELLQAGSREETIKALEASLEKAKAARDAARLAWERAEVRAVRGGIVDSVNFLPGEMVPAGAVLVTLLDLDKLWVTVYVPETQIGQVRLRQEALIAADSLPGRRFKGKVEYIAPEAEFTPRNIQSREERAKTVFAVKVGILEGLGELKPGMPVDVELVEG